MNSPFTGLRLAVLASLVSSSAALAFPPAPDGLVYGLVRDQYGAPLVDTTDHVILQTPAGVQVVASIQPGLAIGVNYAVRVPMDAGIIPVSYVANALTTGSQYKLYVVVGTTTNLPIEMTGAYLVLGAPSQQTLQNLTLGADANQDGIPDAWETAFLASIGTSVALANINPDADYAHDGRALRQEYLLGNYPYNPNDFRVTIVSQNAGSVVLAFTTAAGRTYTAYGSTDLQNWTPLSFTAPPAGSGAVNSYYSPAVQTLQIQTIAPVSAPQMQFFRLQAQ